MDLEMHTGQRIEVEHDGQRIRGRVIRGPARAAVLIEELGQVGEQRSDIHQELTLLRTWTGRQLKGARLVAELSSQLGPASDPRPSSRAVWNESVAMAEADPATPPPDWDSGLLAWAEAVHAARRRVERSRKAMLQALRQAG